jgi:hypothetical protein
LNNILRERRGKISRQEYKTTEKIRFIYRGLETEKGGMRKRKGDRERRCRGESE